MPEIHQLPPGVVVVTGARRGLGRGLVEHLRHRERPVIAVVRSLEHSDLPPDGAALQVVEADLSTAPGIERAIEGLQAALGSQPLAALVNGAGAVTPIGPLAHHSSEAMLSALTLMAVAPARLSGALAQRMVSGGRILNLSTRAAHATFPGLSLYCMSKHALHSVSRSLQQEMPQSIAVAELIPGEVDTGMQADLRVPDPGDFELAAFFRSNRPNLIPTAVAVEFIAWVLLNTPVAAFGREEPWFIYDANDQPHWLPKGVAFNYPKP